MTFSENQKMAKLEREVAQLKEQRDKLKADLHGMRHAIWRALRELERHLDELIKQAGA